MHIDLDNIYRLKKNVLLAEFDGAGVLFDLNSRRCVELNQTGVEVLGYINGRDPLSMIITRFAANYDKTVEHLQEDLAHFIAMLLERNLIDGGQRTEN